MKTFEVEVVGDADLDNSCIPFTGVYLKGITPTGLTGDYAEVFVGYFFPFLNLSPTQCVFDKNGLVGCRYATQTKYLSSECALTDLNVEFEIHKVLEVLDLVRITAAEGLNLFLVDCLRRVKSFHVRIVL